MKDSKFKILYEILLDTAEVQKGKVAFIEIDEEGHERNITFEKLLECVRKLSYKLINLGIRQDDKVIIFSENCLEWVIYFFAINQIGGVCVPLDPKLDVDAVKKISLNSEAKYCFISRKRLEELGVEENSFYKLIDSFENINSYANSFTEIIYNNLACLIYTSGTTGDPKAVMLSNENYLSNLKSIYELHLANQNDIFLCLLPLYHSFPLMVNLLLPVFYGATSVLLKTLRTDVIRKTIVDKKVTVIPAVPLFYKNLMDGISRKLKDKKYGYLLFVNLIKLSCYIRKKIRLNIGRVIFGKLRKILAPNLRFFISGGARLDPEVFRFFYGLGFNILEGYGLTEASPVVSFNPLNREKEGSVGKALPGIDIKIERTEKDIDGEVLVKGGNVMLGYWKNDISTIETLVDGWLKTGDVGYLDKDGYLFITGRKKEIIVLSNGKNIYPDEIEEFYLKNVKYIQECVAIPVVDKGEIGLGIVIKTDVERRDEVRKEVSQISKMLPDYKRPRKVFFTDEEIPKTNLGKPKRSLVKRMFEAEKPVQIREKVVIYDDPLVLKVIESLRKIAEKKDIFLESDLELDLGLDSLKKIELTLELENNLGIKLPDGFMVNILTVDDLINNLKKFSFPSITSQKKNFEDLILETPSEEDIRQIDIRKGLLFNIFEYIFFLFVKLTSNVLYKIEVEGLEKIKNTNSPFIIAPNHLSYLDGYILTGIINFKIKKKLFFVGLADFFEKTILKVFKKVAGVLSFDEIKEPIRAIRTSIYVIKKGYSICIFPEGARSYDGKLMELKKGIAYIAKNTKVPLFPVYIQGTFEAWPRFKKYPKFFKKIKIIVGDPIHWQTKENYTEDDFVKEVKNNLILLSKGVEKK
ncbi:MAG: AMP-binding protein [Proteobacteria bacterium]|nr:AMP-binding protein [Pseudomonadota bacterium]